MIKNIILAWDPVALDLMAWDPMPWDPMAWNPTAWDPMAWETMPKWRDPGLAEKVHRTHPHYCFP